MRTIYTITTLLLLLCFTCTEKEVIKGKKAADAKVIPSSSASSASAEDSSLAAAYTLDPALNTTLDQYFSPTAADFLRRLDREFTTELRRRIGNRPANFLYGVQADRIQSQIIDKQTLSHLHPFGPEDLRLADLGELGQVEFLSTKCGFQEEQSGHTINYACLSRDPSLFAFLNSFGEDNPMIREFISGVQNNGGSLPPSFRQTMVFSTASNLDFSYPPHRLFYALAQLLWVDEQDAIDQVDAIKQAIYQNAQSGRLPQEEN